MIGVPLVRERSTVQSCAAAPPKPFEILAFLAIRLICPFGRTKQDSADFGTSTRGEVVEKVHGMFLHAESAERG